MVILQNSNYNFIPTLYIKYFHEREKNYTILTLCSIYFTTVMFNSLKHVFNFTVRVNLFLVIVLKFSHFRYHCIFKTLFVWIIIFHILPLYFHFHSISLISAFCVFCIWINSCFLFPTWEICQEMGTFLTTSKHFQLFLWGFIKNQEIFTRRNYSLFAV